MEGGWGGLGLGAWAWARGFRSLLHSRTGGVFGLPPRLQTGNNYSHFAGRDWVRLSAGIDSDELPGVPDPTDVLHGNTAVAQAEMQRV